MDNSKVRKLFIFGTLFWSVVIIFLSVIPANDLPRIKIQNIDKLVHFGLFLVYGFLMSGAIIIDNKKKYIFIVVILCLFLFGWIMETIQGFLPDRTSDIKDIMFNTSGAILGVSVYLVLKRKIFKG
ncbi:MAG: VanZ family protein [Cyclobacteriaceae bacterium]|nr:VanZ family protein [Cyclobacteriaceae bacterium]